MSNCSKEVVQDAEPTFGPWMKVDLGSQRGNFSRVSLKPDEWSNRQPYSLSLPKQRPQSDSGLPETVVMRAGDLISSGKGQTPLLEVAPATEGA